MSTPHDGNGRLWERFELGNINDRIENLYLYFKNTVHGDKSVSVSGSGLTPKQEEEYLDKVRNTINDQLNSIIKDLEIKYNQNTKNWKETNQKLKKKNNNLDNKVNDLQKANNLLKKDNLHLNEKYNKLRNGLDQIINDSTKKNEKRILQLTDDLREARNDRANDIKQAKQKIKQLKDEISNLQDKYDQLKLNFDKIRNDRDNIIRERDNLNKKCIIFRENRDHDNANLRDQLKEIRKHSDDINDKYNKLRNQYDKLENDYTILNEQYNLEKEAFKNKLGEWTLNRAQNDLEKDDQDIDLNSNANENMKKELEKQRQSLNREWDNKMKKKENEFIAAKNKSIKILDDQYREIKDQLMDNISNLNDSNNDLKKDLNDLKNKCTKLENENSKISGLRDIIRSLNDKLNDKDSNILSLKKDLSKYKILWQHFFGLDAPLKDEIKKLNMKLDKFENYHNIDSPIKKKYRRIILESLERWNDPDRQPPVVLDAIPSPNDKYQRIELYNVNNDQVIEFRGFKLVNNNGDIIELDSRQIRPGGYIGIALKKKRYTHDILASQPNFCKFTDNEVIWLADSFDNKIQLFPINEAIYDNLTDFSPDESPLIIKQIFNENNFKGFVFGNTTNRKIKLKNMYFTNDNNTLREPIPFKSLPKNGIIRLIITDNKNDSRVLPNDIIIPNNKIKILSNKSDKLLLSDSFNNTLELYNIDQLSNKSDKNTYGPSLNECYIM